MKKTAFLASLAAALVFAGCGDNTTETAETTETTVAAEAPATAEGETYSVVPEQSDVKWHGTKVTGEHRGEIEVQRGELKVADGQVTGGTIVMDMATISNTDLTDKEYNDKLVGHLKSDDFFGVEKYPTATFELTNLTPIEGAAAGAPNYNVEGNLTIKDKTNKVDFPATISVENGVAKAKADVTVDRSKYDARYGSTSFFDNLGDKAISDEFTVSFDVTARK